MKHTNDVNFLIYDFGTSALKVALFDCKMDLLCIKSEEMFYSYPAQDCVEIEARMLWEMAARLTKDISDEVSLESVAAVNITSNGETVIPVDSTGNPLRNAMVWLDCRAKHQAAKLEKKLGTDEFYSITGQDAIDPIWPVNKICWIKDTEPDIYGKTYKFLLLKDYFVFMLTGIMCTEPSIASCSGLMNITTKKWSEKIIHEATLSIGKLPTIIEPNSKVGKLTERACKAFGLGANILVLSGMLDQCGSAIGAGNVSTGMITETTGTVLAVVTTLDSVSQTYKRKKLPYIVHGINNKYLALTYAPTAAIVLKWFKDNFCPDLINQANENNINVYQIIADIIKQTEIKPNLIISSYFKGRIYPQYQPEAKGIISGITLDTKRDDIMRAIYESVSFMLLENLEYLKGMGIVTDNLISLGGASKSDSWCQIKTDIVGSKITTLENQESTVLGAAMSASIALNILKSYNDIHTFIKVNKVYAPQLSASIAYSKKYILYRQLLSRNYADSNILI